MKHCYRLDLPINPLNPLRAEEVLSEVKADPHWWKGNPPWKVYYNKDELDSLLSSEILTKLNSLGLDPIGFTLFYLTKEIPDKRSYIHQDISFINGKWTKTPFAINFELNPTTSTTISWWDTSSVQEYFDDDEHLRTAFKYANAIRYHEDRLKSNPKYLKLPLKETFSLEGNTFPVLFRTDIAHSVISKTAEGQRYNLSIRFDSSKVESFEKAVELLQPVIVGSSTTN